jgi:hypothetical protein
MDTSDFRSCWMCGRPVRLEDCKIDEHGLAVHGNCYLARVALQNAMFRPKRVGRDDIDRR